MDKDKQDWEAKIEDLRIKYKWVGNFPIDYTVKLKKIIKDELAQQSQAIRKEIEFKLQHPDRCYLKVKDHKYVVKLEDILKLLEEVFKGGDA